MSGFGENIGRELGTGIKVVKRASAALPQTTQSALFTVHGGSIWVVQIYGVVTTAIQNQANNTKVVFNPTTGSDVDLCAVASTANLAVNALLGITGTLATALQTGLAIVGQSIPQLVGTGTIDLSCAASNTGAVEWYIAYRRADPRGRVTAA